MRCGPTSSRRSRGRRPVDYACGVSVGIWITIAALAFLVLVIAVPVWVLRRQGRIFPEGSERPEASTDRSDKRRFRITSPWMWGGRG
jgi:hypothetical protein